MPNDANTSDVNTPAVIVTEIDNILLMRINRPRVKNALNREAL
jgi:enoyl-CoA hydratase/carnithine racemase